jgi:aminopeptidase N
MLVETHAARDAVHRDADGAFRGHTARFAQVRHNARPQFPGMIRAFFLRAALSAAVLSCLAAPAGADAPFSFDTAFGRLPKNVRPLAYRIAIAPSAATMTLTGSESIDLEVRSATPTITFNSLNETLHDVTFDGAPVARTASSNAQQLTTVTLRSPARPGRHVLAFAYRGKIETGPLGLFAQAYVRPDGVHGVLLSTQLESTDARRVFPCWDEPAFRATFTLTATVEKTLASVSNMPIVKRTVHGALATTTFARTPSMPAYLVEYTAGDIARISEVKGRTTFGVWAVRGQENDGRIALANSERILADYNAYFGFPYPLPKLDSIAVPGGFQGAMENWGAITYNDQSLLVTPSSTLNDQQQVFSFQAHEMAHQWNGDLVTMGWWDDLWLNESFASWRAAKETDLRHPDWHWWENQDGDKESAMRADARLTSHPIHVHITDELQAENAFDAEITYAKGQAFLRMLEAYLTPDVFRAGIRRYIRARAYSNATGADLWLALGAASGKNVAGLAADWINRPGFPLVSVTASCDRAGSRTIALAQQRFLLDGTAAAAPWSIPLRVRSAPNGPITSVLFSGPRKTARAGRCGEPLTLDAGNPGFFRVAYDDATFRANAAAFGRLPDPDRIALLDDQWALASSGRAPLATYFAIARAMGGDLDARAWEQITSSLDYIEYRERGSRGYDAFTAFARAIVKPVADRLGWDAKPNETPGIANLRQTVLLELGTWGDTGVIAEARKRFGAFVTDRRAIGSDDQETILGIVALNADAATFEQLHAIAKDAQNETDVHRYYSALMSVRDDALAKQALAIALSSEMHAQSEAQRLDFVQKVAALHPALAWQTFKDNVTLLLAPLGPANAPAVLAQSVPVAFWDAAPPNEIQAFVGKRTPADLRPMLARGMEQVRFFVKQRTLLDRSTDAYVAMASKTAAVTIP